MNAEGTEGRLANEWRFVHKCPRCGHIIPLQDMGLKAITSGIVHCPGCHRSAQIEIAIIDRGDPANQPPG